MKISYNWLKEFVPDLTLTPAEVANVLTMHSYETVIAEEFALDPTIQIVKILTIEPHPNADRLRLATVTNGSEEIRVVCGAPNITEGMVVPYAPVGAKVQDKDGQLFELTKVKIRGVESPGMLNSRRELGLGSDHDGIFALPEDTAIGSLLVEHLPADTILECDITANRAHDSLCHRGVARELAALLGLKLHEPKIEKLPKSEHDAQGFFIAVSSTDIAPRYMNIIASGVTNQVSPLWLQAKLYVLGVKPINALVDITNYVMYEMGNPLHVFDSRTLPGKQIGVREAKEGEALTLLDDKVATLSAGMPVITSNDTVVALAGVMGGKATGAAMDTTDVVIEIGNFTASRIQRVVQQTNIRTEAAARFLKGIDPNMVEDAARRTLHLLQTITGAHIEGVLDYYPEPFVSPHISFRPEQVEKVAGIAIGATESRKQLEVLRCAIEGKDSDTEWQVTPPTDRLDLSHEHDLVEEVVRMVGLEKIASNTEILNVPAEPLAKEIYAREVVRSALVQKGFTETYNYSFEPEYFAQALNIAKDDHINIVNPISPEQSYLRTSLLPGLLQNFVKNKAEFQRKIADVRPALFEIGHVYRTGEGERVKGVVEDQYLALMLIGSEGYTEMVLNDIARSLGVTSLETKPLAENDIRFVATSSKAVAVGGEEIGVVGMVAPDALRKIKQPLNIFACELNLDRLIAAASIKNVPAQSLADIVANTLPPVKYSELAKYPSVFRDISLLIASSVPDEQVREVIERAGGELVAKATLFDVYEQENSDKKSLAFHIEFQSPERTLQDAEVDTIYTNIVKALEVEIEAQVR